VIPLTRRDFGSGVASLAAGASALVEPVLRLPPSDKPTVALTLDACPGNFDERLARALTENAIPATIFLTSLWIRHNPNGMAFLLAHHDLFSFQNHGDRHLPPVLGMGSVYGLRTAGTLDGIRTEIARATDAIAAATGDSPKWYRGAAALYSPEVLPAIRQMGFGVGGFSLNADSGASLPAASVAARIAKARNGDVLIGHINQPLRPSGAGIAAGVVALKNQGMAFARLPSVPFDS
jgi:peptidoglycan/xylan/chitin deacetylase (PgdA/CDA1 family)